MVAARTAQQAIRFFLGAIFSASALGKSLDLSAFVDILVTYQIFPDWALWPMALSICGAEWLLAVWMFSGWHISAGALSAIALNGLYATGLTVTLLRGIDLPNCGCYGVFYPQPLRWYSPLEDLVLVGMCYALRRGAQKNLFPH